MSSPLHSLKTLALLALCLCQAGCAEEAYEGPVLIAVDGSVTLDAKPLAGAVLVFVPTGETLGQGAVGHTDEQGHFTLASHRGHQGVPEGTYRVVISKCTMPDGRPCPEQASLPPMDSAARETLPGRYSSFEHSKLTAAVAPSVPLEFHLTSIPDRRRHVSRW